MQIGQLKFIGILLVAAASTFLWWFVKDGGEPSRDNTYSALDPKDPSTPNKVKAIRSRRSSDVQTDAKRSKSEEKNADKKWMESHSSVAVITQELDNDYSEPRGFLTFKGVKIDLGETPPWYRFHLKSIQGPLLFGEKDSRHRYEKTLKCLIEIKKGDYIIDNIVSLSVPRFAKGVSGFLVKRNQNPIQEVGVIVPKLNVPEGFDASSESFAVKTRVNGKELLLDDIQLKSYEIRNPSNLILLYSGQDMKLSKVLWIKLENAFE